MKRFEFAFAPLYRAVGLPRFRQSVAGLAPLGRLRDPALSVTVADIDGLVAALNRGTGPGTHPEGMA